MLGQSERVGAQIGEAAGIVPLQTVDLTQANQLIYGVVLVLMMLYRRQGLIPARRIVRALERSKTRPSRPRGAASRPTSSLARRERTHQTRRAATAVRGTGRTLWRRDRRRPHRLSVYPGRDRQRHRPEWLRQDHALQHADRHWSAPTRHGRVYHGVDITRLPPHKIARLGIRAPSRTCACSTT